MKTSKIIRAISFAVIVGGMAFNLSTTTANPNGVTVCHCVQGDCKAELVISEAALATHLDHGDTAGPCSPEQL